MNPARMFSLTRKLISIDSTFGNEMEIGRFLADYLAKLGMSVKTFEVGEGRKNIFATYDSSHPGLVFNTHIDTVPQQFGPFEDEERIYGRGACDTHGVLAAQLEAITDLHDEGVPGLGLLLVVGEETSHDGAIHAGKCEEILEPAVLIVGEPTENRLMRSQKGRLKATLIAHGVAGHSGYPEKFDSAVEKLCLALNRLWQAPWLVKDSKEGTTVNVTLSETDGADNQIPAQASARLMFRCSESCQIIRKQVTDLIDEVTQNLPQRHLEQHFKLEWDPAENDPVTDLETLENFETGTAAYNTDIAYFGWTSCLKFLIGPGSILQAHRDLRNGDWPASEWIDKNEQIKGVSIYKRLVRAILSFK